MEVMRKQCRNEREVIYYDLADFEMAGYNKFIPYFLHPNAIYSVGVSRFSQRIKIGVGSNPWQPVPDDLNLAAICERYGGGGHPRVAAISFEPQDIEKARQVSLEITEELRRMNS